MNDRERLANLRQDFLKKSSEDWTFVEADQKWERFEKKIPPTSRQIEFAWNLISELQREWHDDAQIVADIRRVRETIDSCDDISQMSNIIEKLKELLEMSRSR